MPWEEAEKTFSSSSVVFGVQTWTISLSRQKNWGQRTKVCMLNSPSHRYILDDHYLNPRVPRGVLEKVVSLSSLEGSDLIPLRWLLLLQNAASSFLVIVLIWRGVCPANLNCSLWEVSVLCHKDVISSVLFGIQGDCKMTVKRMA
jgi:hypothetical protein